MEPTDEMVFFQRGKTFATTFASFGLFQTGGRRIVSIARTGRSRSFRFTRSRARTTTIVTLIIGIVIVHIFRSKIDVRGLEQSLPLQAERSFSHLSLLMKKQTRILLVVHRLRSRERSGQRLLEEDRWRTGRIEGHGDGHVVRIGDGKRHRVRMIRVEEHSRRWLKHPRQSREAQQECSNMNELHRWRKILWEKCRGRIDGHRRCSSSVVIIVVRIVVEVVQDVLQTSKKIKGNRRREESDRNIRLHWFGRMDGR